MNERQLKNTIAFLVGGLVASYATHEYIIHHQQKTLDRISETLDFVAGQENLQYKLFSEAYSYLSKEQRIDLWDKMAFDITVHQGMMPERFLKEIRKLEKELDDKGDEAE